MASPIDRMIDAAELRCTVCNAPRGKCDCWSECACGWSFLKSDKCRNPVHGAVKLHCPKCGKDQQAAIDDTDPKGTATIHIECPDCNRDRDSPRYFDKNGIELTFTG